MSAEDWPLLEPAEEEALHLARLLTVDERPFVRITKRLLAKDALISRFPIQLPTPPPDATQDTDIDVTVANSTEEDDEARRRYHDEVMLDFAHLESTILRIQFLKDANERERERYAAEKSKILATAESVRVNTAELRIQLAQAQKTLNLKKQYDDLAETIFKDKALKSRDILEGENDKLRAEIEELEQEGRDFGGLWKDRKERFDRVVDEGKSLVRFIKGEKDEEPSEDDEQAQESDIKGESSTAGTPRPDMGSATPRPDTGSATPRPDMGSATPMHTDLDGDDGAQAAQQALANRAIGSQHASSASTSKVASPTQSPSAEGEGGDTEMQEARASHPESVEEGEFTTDDAAAPEEEKMDTT